MIAAASTLAAVVAGAFALRYGSDRVVELAKEFGGGFAAYWTHHVFHKVWHTAGHLRPRKGGRQ